MKIIFLLFKGNLSMTRLRNFLLLDEINEANMLKDTDAGSLQSDVAISLKNLNLGWSTSEASLSK